MEENLLKILGGSAVAAVLAYGWLAFQTGKIVRGDEHKREVENGEKWQQRYFHVLENTEKQLGILKETIDFAKEITASVKVMQQQLAELKAAIESIKRDTETKP